MSNMMFNVINSSDDILHSFSEKENANKYIELSNKISGEELDIDEVIVTDNIDLKIVEVVTITANLYLNQDIKLYVNTKKMINIDVVEKTTATPIYMGGIYEYKIVKIIPSLESKKDDFIEKLKADVKDSAIKRYNNYVLSNNLKNVFTLSPDEIAFVNKVLALHKEVCDINNKILEESNDEDLLFQLFVTNSSIEDIEILQSRADDNSLKKYNEYKELMKEYDKFKSKYKFRA